jgi:PAS domain S-box-containing protein
MPSRVAARAVKSSTSSDARSVVNQVPKLPEASLRLEEIVRWSDDAIASQDLDGTITSWNRGAEAIFGYTADEVVGQSIRLLVPEDRIAEDEDVLRRVAAGEVVHHFETVRLAKGGKPVDVSLTVSPIKDRRGRIVGVSKIARDIGDRKRSEEANEQLQRERADLEKEAARMKNEFLSMLTHELRTPLGSILGWSELLLKDELDEAQAQEALETIHRNANTQSKILGDLMDLSRISHGLLQLERTSVSVERVLQDAIDVVQPVAAAKRVEIEFHRPSAMFFVSGDLMRLQQVFWNVLSNAVKFTPPQGRIDVRLRQLIGRIRVTIQDTGDGIQADFIPHVFSRFRQGENARLGRRGGLGLGMALVREVVEMHQGTAKVESAGIGKGTTVTIELPESHGSLVEQKTAAYHARRTKALRELKILVVDDRPDDSRLVKLILERTGADVKECLGAADALETLQAWRPDLLISDLAMAQEGGLALIAKVRALPDAALRRTPAIAVSAHAASEVREHALQAGFEEYLPKPVEAGSLLPTILQVRSLVQAG